MTAKIDKRAAIAAYKEKKTRAGIYAVRCAASGEVWVGASPTLDAVENRMWFELKMGERSNPSLLAAYQAHGREGLAYEELEVLKPEEDAYLRRAQLKDRAAHWCAALSAKALL
ncbi:MAG: GIY-YIG nuclease family protein [Alphaproteobacteria bacterium]|nr:GIY-YIG nuclease family protein [Alphaproteobacteria bacterium]